jgi:hypothetical protein
LDISLATYRDVRDWSRAIREEVIEQRMPPSTAAPGFGRFQNTISLTARERTTLLAWLDGGMPRGEEKDLPAAIDAPPAVDADTQAADIHLALPPQEVPALQDLVIRRITIDPRLSVDRLVSRIVVRPGTRGVLRGALVSEEKGARRWVGAWLPWQHVFAAPEGRAFKLTTQTPLTVTLYYRGGEATIIDRSAVDVYFAGDAARPLETFAIETDARGSGQLTLPHSTTLWALQPTFGKTTKSVEVRARRPDGSIEVLMWVPVARLEWPGAFVLEEPITLPEATVLTVAARADDSALQADRVILSGWTAMPHRR